MKKILGKIEQVEFGKIWDRENLFGLILCLKTSDSSGVVYTNVVNMQKTRIKDMPNWNEKRAINLVEMNEFIYKLLNDAKVSTIDQLVNVPIEITFKNNLLKDFRILTEVL
jgi:hypothetical protein